MKSLGLRSERGCSGWAVLGWVLLVAVGVGLAWYGFTWTEGEDDRQSVSVQPSATVPATLLPSPTVVPTLAPTYTPLPTFTLEPTPIPATATPVIASIVAGADGANVRSGPGTNFARLDYLDPGTQAQVIGRYSNWWQIEYNGAAGWVFGEIVTASNVEGVSQVQPPPSPTPVPPAETPTPIATPTPAPTSPPTLPPGPPAEFHGLVPNDYWVEGAPGPFGAGGDIWFNMDITNASGGAVHYEALGTWVQETDQFQKSWTYQVFDPGDHFVWRDRINIPAAGTYNLWMRICFTSSACANLKGPIVVDVQ